MRTETIREEIAALLRRVPFEPFYITLESGERALIEHPENVAFAPNVEAETRIGQWLRLVLGNYVLMTTFAAVTSVAYQRSDEIT